MDKIQKVFGYITQKNSLLVFKHQNNLEMYPQVPGGTVEPLDDVYSAVVREIKEETGLSHFKIRKYL